MKVPSNSFAPSSLAALDPLGILQHFRFNPFFHLQFEKMLQEAEQREHLQFILSLELDEVLGSAEKRQDRFENESRVFDV